MQATLHFLVVLSLTGWALGASSTNLTEPLSVRVSDSAIASIREIIEEEIRSNVVGTCLGLSPQTAASSCKEIAEKLSDSQSGDYFIGGPAGPQRVYCEMAAEFNQSGGWMKVASIDMRDTHTQCPNGLSLNVTSSKRTCSRPDPAPGCATTTFPVHNVAYKKVCGKVIGYQTKETNGFGPTRFTPLIGETYVDGVSITHGVPRQHIWTLASAIGELKHFHDPDTGCPCLDTTRSFIGTIPSYVGNDYYCETGNRGSSRDATRTFTEDPLWDGEGCEGNNSCCQRGGPWFCKELESTTCNDIELRVCVNNPPRNEEVLVEQIELYVQ